MHTHHSQHSQAHWHQYFGLYDQKGNVPLPLKKIAVNAKINDYIAEVTYTQTYCNPSDIRLDTEYFFPIANTACFHKFQAKFGTTMLEGVVKKKEEARQEYNRHNQEGHTVAYAEVTDDNYSVLCVKIGNIPPSSEIEIVFSYIERLEISLNKFWRFTLFSCLVSKSEHEIFQSSYNPALESAKNHSLVDYPYVKDGKKARKGPQWEVNIEVDSRSPITFIKSPSHEVEITESQLSNIFSAKVSLFKLKAYTPNRDFVLLYATDAIHKPSYLLSPFEEGYCTLINFFPEISYMSFDDAYMASLDGKDPLEKMIESAKNEFVFVIDKSNTLDRESAGLLLEALRFFLESLPSDSYCTVLIIGDQEFPDQSVRTTPEASASFLGKVRNAMPTSGKSRIVEAFETVGKMDIIPGYFRLVFLLTDGQLDTTASEVTQTIREKLFKTRVFVLGIGDASITDFTKKTALEGYGTCEVVREAGEIAEKVTFLLKTAIAPYFTDFELKIENESLFSYVVPLPKVIGCISPNELVEFFVVFNKKLDIAKKTTFSLKFYNGFNQRVEQFKQDIDVECADLSEAVVKLGMLKFCESLVKKKEIYEAMGDGEIVKSFKEDVQKSLVNTSIRHGILTSETAFVCLVKEGDDITRQIPSEKITMPSRLGLENRDSDEEVVNVVSFYRQRTLIHHTNTQSPSHIYNLEHEMKPDVVVFSDAIIPEERNIEHLERREEHLEYQAATRIQRVIEERLPQMQVVNDVVIEYLEKREKSSDSSVRGLEKVDTTPKASKSPKLSKTNKESLLEKISKTAGSKRSPKKTDFRTGVAKNSRANYTKTAKTMTPERVNRPKLNVSPPVSVISSDKKLPLAGRTSSPAKFANKTYYVKPANNTVLDAKNKLNKITPQKPKIDVVNSPNNEGKSISITGLKTILSPKSGKDLSKSQSVSSISNSESKRMITPAEKRKAIELDTISKTSQYLVGLQKDKGYWEPQVVIGNLLRYNLAALMKKIPKELQAIQDREKVWVTILILTWIQYYGLNKDKWEGASKKAMSWLEENGKMYDLYSNSAKLAFGF